MSFTRKLRLNSSLFPALHALVYAILFALTESFIARDINKIISWSAGGFAIGLVLGIVIQLALSHLQKRVAKVFILSGLLLLQFHIGLFLLGPSI